MKYFITEQDIKDNTTVQQNVDASLLQPFISLAQDKHIKKVLSMGLYGELFLYVNRASETEVEDDMEDLLKELKTACIYWTAVEALPFLQTKIANVGLINKAAAKGESIDATSYRALENSFRTTADFYTGELVTYLEKNVPQYPNYKAPKADSTTRLLAGISFD